LKFFENYGECGLDPQPDPLASIPVGGSCQVTPPAFEQIAWEASGMSCGISVDTGPGGGVVPVDAVTVCCTN
jgi:hypothetical protein